MQTRGNEVPIAAVISTCLKNKLTFAAYRLPARSDITAVIQKDHREEAAEDFSGLLCRKGFIIAPFAMDGPKKRFVVCPDILVKNSATMKQLDDLNLISPIIPADFDRNDSHETTREEFLVQANEIIAATIGGDFEKIVLSRVKYVTVETDSRLQGIFSSLCATYPDAFVYIFRIQGQCWIGATPEPFLCSEGERLATVSLAGTRPFTEKNRDVKNWNNKERLEQEIVTRQIEGLLGEFNISDIDKKGPFTRKTANLLHLCTSFSFPYENVAQQLNDFVNALHPTSAVCGIPKEKSRRLITSLEKHDREFYAGFLGPIGIDGRMQLFVNLRCMKVYKDGLALFVGGGITAGSIAKDEWEETEMKAETILSVLRGAS